tara:strand:- start:2614 stop:3156 length:543 start_codon:yes stop_codon:yes gene_type:complete
MKAIYDLEWTTKNNFREIIQIGYILCDDKFEIIHKKKLHYIYPIINQNISNHVSNLTGITDNVLKKKGVTFKFAMGTFLEDIKNTNVIYSFGYDINIIKENYIKHKLNYSFSKNLKFKNIRFSICKFLKIGYYSISSSELKNLCGKINTNNYNNLIAHNALHDSLSIFYFLKFYNKNLNA